MSENILKNNSQNRKLDFFKENLREILQPLEKLLTPINFCVLIIV